MLSLIRSSLRSSLSHSLTPSVRLPTLPSHGRLSSNIYQRDQVRPTKERTFYCSIHTTYLNHNFAFKFVKTNNFAREANELEIKDKEIYKSLNGDYEPETFSNKPVIALIGRPNVGKSTLFNHLVSNRIRKALTGPIPGTTRDRAYGTAQWLGRSFTVVDTGGLIVSGGRDSLTEQVKAQSLIALEEAHGLTNEDREIARYLRHTKVNTPIVVVVNKSDNLEQRDSEGDTLRPFCQLGLGTPMGISAIHGDGFGDLLDLAIQSFPELPPEPSESTDLSTDPASPVPSIRVAIVGAPNVGKSSLLNEIVGTKRAVVSSEGGTTKDPIDHVMEHNGQSITLIDTAGVRRKGTHHLGLERVSALWALRVIERSHVVLLVVEPELGVGGYDQRIAEHILEHRKSVIVVINKWDKVREYPTAAEEYTKHIREKLHFLSWVPVVFTSALTGYHVRDLLDLVLRVFQERSRRIATHELNELLRGSVAKHNLNSKPNSKLKFKFVMQTKQFPPTFVLYFNKPSDVHFSYQRYLENTIREAYSFTGTPIQLLLRENERKPKREKKKHSKKKDEVAPPSKKRLAAIRKWTFDPSNPHPRKEKQRNSKHSKNSKKK